MTQTELLEIARRLLEDGGPDALTMDRLAREAGIGRSSVYRLIGSREALLDLLAAAGVDTGERADVRERVLAAAREVFGRVGLDGATIEAIAEVADVGTATIYRHFGDKAGLLRAFVASHAPRRAVWATAAAPSGDLATDLERVVQAALEHLTGNAPLIRLMLMERLRGSDALGELAQAPDRTIHGLTRILEHYGALGQIEASEAPRLARALMGMVFSFGLLGDVWALPGDCVPARDARFLVDLFLRGAPAPGASVSQRGAP